MSDRRTETRTAAETEAVGARLAERLAPGDVVVVSGEVGAGKTTLIRGAARALGVTEPVTSPTFTIGRRYVGGRLPISHLDLYRLEDMEVEDPALIDDYLGGDGVALRCGSNTPVRTAARSRSSASPRSRSSGR
jgi:tRNA threonylcarbamoyladenosine biosynthesis protein TsaE